MMVTLHALIGIGEAVITGSVVSLIYQQRPDLIYEPAKETSPAAQTGRFLAAGLVCSLAVGAFLSPFASEAADGLDTVAGKFKLSVSDDAVPGLFEDYDQVPMPFSDWQGLSVSVAGIGGTLIVFALAMLLGRFASIGRSSTAMPEASSE